MELPKYNEQKQVYIHTVGDIDFTLKPHGYAICPCWAILANGKPVGTFHPAFCKGAMGYFSVGTYYTNSADLPCTEKDVLKFLVEYLDNLTTLGSTI